MSNPHEPENAVVAKAYESFYLFAEDPLGDVSAFVRRRWQEIEAKHGVALRFVRDVTEIQRVDRGNMPMLAAYDPATSHAVSHYGFIARAGDTDVATFGAAIYQLGDRDLAEFLEEVGLDRHDGPVSLEGEAKLLATGCRGVAAFGGNAWVHRDYRQGGLLVDMTEVSRAMSIAMFGCDHAFMFMKASLAKRGFGTHAQAFCPGVWFGDEERWLGYTGRRAILRTSRDSSVRDAPRQASTH